MPREKWPTKDEWDVMEWLHVYGQYSYHSEATIRGTRAALVRLREAIDAAIESGMGKARVIASDGEGYSLEVIRVALHDQLGEPEYILEQHGRLLSEEAKRAREYGLRDPFGSYKRVDPDPRTETAQQPDASTATTKNETATEA